MLNWCCFVGESIYGLIFKWFRVVFNELALLGKISLLLFELCWTEWLFLLKWLIVAPCLVHLGTWFSKGIGRSHPLTCLIV